MLKPSPLKYCVTVFGDWVYKEVVKIKEDHKSRALSDGISVLKKQKTAELAFSKQVEKRCSHSKKAATYKPVKEALYETQPSQHRNLQNYKKK